MTIHYPSFHARARLLAAFAFICPFLSAGPQWAYPLTKTVDASDTYFGTTYEDPYRWLENLKDDSVKAWFKAQADLTDSTLDKIPGRDALVREWQALDKLRPARYGGFDVEGGRVFYKKTLGGENVGKLYCRDSWNGAEKLLFDPTTYKPGTTTTLESFVPSDDGRHVAIGLSAKGAEWSELRVIDVASGALLPETIYPSYGAFSWTLDGTGFFYDAGRQTDITSMDIKLNRKTRLHRLGSDVASDVDFFGSEKYPELGIEPKEFCGAYVDESYPQYVFANVSTVQNEMKIFYAPISEAERPRIAWKVLCKPSDSLVRGIAFAGDYVYAVTYRGAPQYKVVRTRVDHPDWDHAETVIAEAKDSIQSLAKTKNYLFVTYSNGITGRIVKYALATGKISEVALPLGGDLGITCPDFQSDLSIVSVASWALPTSLFDYEAAAETVKKSVFDTTVTYPGFDQVVSEEVEVPGEDGTPIPLSIVHKKGIPMDGTNSCILDGYGAYGYSTTPYFTVQRSLALHGVVQAFAHVRGGSEKGEAWYRAGFKTTKPNTWKDFIACAKYLEKAGYTSPGKLGGTGTSAGGILITRAITERPDLFAAAVCNVGCANAMRLEFSPNGPVNIPEFGTVKDPVECKALYEMDGVQHVVKGVKYPAVLGVGGWNDPRVQVWQPGKFVAAVQAASTSGRPAFMKVNYDDGHFTEDKLVTFKNFASQFAFLLWQTGHPDFQPAG